MTIHVTVKMEMKYLVSLEKLTKNILAEILDIW